MKNVILEQVSTAEIPQIRHLAIEIWPKNYAEILSAAQIEYMMQMMYAEDVLQNQLESGVWFYLVKFSGRNIGFLAIEPHYKFPEDMYVHKIYLLPEFQGKGFGRNLMNQVVEVTKKNHCKSISLNVNRYNKAQHFYEKTGFEIKFEENIDIGQGFLMEDYVMQKML